MWDVFAKSAVDIAYCSQLILSSILSLNMHLFFTDLQTWKLSEEGYLLNKELHDKWSYGDMRWTIMQAVNRPIFYITQQNRKYIF